MQLLREKFMNRFLWSNLNISFTSRIWYQARLGRQERKQDWRCPFANSRLDIRIVSGGFFFEGSRIISSHPHRSYGMGYNACFWIYILYIYSFSICIGVRRSLGCDTSPGTPITLLHRAPNKFTLWKKKE